MAKLEDIDVTDLESALDRTDEKKPTIRLLAAIIYKRGPSVPMLAEWLDRREATIYRWFDRLEGEESIEMAVRDRPREGRPPKLSEAQRETFRSAVRGPPEVVDVDAPAWTPETAREFLEERLGVEYTNRHVQRLLKSAGLRHRESDRGGADDDEAGRVQNWEPVESPE